MGSMFARSALARPSLAVFQMWVLKFWLGIVVVTDISLGWLVVAVDETDRLRIVLAVLGVVLLSFGAL